MSQLNRQKKYRGTEAMENGSDFLLGESDDAEIFKRMVGGMN